MPIKSVVKIEIDKNNNKYVFSLPAGAPIGECFDAAYDLLDVIKDLSYKSAIKCNDYLDEDEILSYGGTD